MTTQAPKNGLHTEYYYKDQKKEEGNYKDGKKVGKKIGWHENGQKLFEENYKNGELDGKRTFWREDELIGTQRGGGFLQSEADAADDFNKWHLKKIIN